MLTRQITLSVSHGFEIPLVYTKTHDVKAVEEALYLGATIQNMVRSKRSGDEVKKVSEIKDAEIQRIQGMYQEKLTRLLEDIRVVSEEKDRLQSEYLEKVKEAQKNERLTCSMEWEESIRVLKKEHEIVLAKCSAMEASRRVLEESRERDVNEAVRRTEEMMERLVASKQEQLLKMESAYQRLQDSIARQSDEIARLSGTIGKRGANVKMKGSDYEEQFGEKLRRHFGVCQGFGLRDTRLGSGHEMDFSMDVEGHIIMWELKNYSSVVPKAEVDKFLRDLKENPHATVGVMISRSTDIYGKSSTGAMLTEFEGEKMMIYLNRFEEFCGEEEGRVFQMLMSLFRVWWNYYRDESVGWEREEVIREVEKMVEELGRRRTEWRRHKAHLEEMGRWMNDVLEDSEYRLDRILKRTRRAVSDTSAGVVEDAKIPEDVFRDTKDDRDVQWIQSIMRVCVAGDQIEVRELVDLLAPHHKLSKDTIRTNLMSIIRDTAIGKKGVVKYIKGLARYVPPCDIAFSGYGSSKKGS
jgi:hypothetical protein